MAASIALAASLDDIAHRLKVRADEIAAIQALARDPTAAEPSLLGEMQRRVAKLELALASIESAVVLEEGQLDNARAFLSAVWNQKVQMDAFRRSLPPSIGPFEQPVAHALENGQNRNTVSANQMHKSTGGSDPSCVSSTPTNELRRSRVAANSPRAGTTVREPRQSSVRAACKDSGTAPPVSLFPKIDPVDSTELATCPSYMRGRLTVDKVNAIIDDFHAMLEAKYSVLRCSDLRNMHAADLEKISTWEKEETKDTQGLFFISEVDLQQRASELQQRGESAVLKFDTTGKACLTVLQHLRRIRSVPGRVKKYAIVG